MAAIPTKYKGVQFRSRLEARWACFFDLCGYKWRYEPVDLAGYIPDFDLLCEDGKPMVVEVKPHESLDVATTEKMESAMPLPKNNDDFDKQRHVAMSILGLGPSEGRYNVVRKIGWTNYTGVWDDLFMFWDFETNRPVMAMGFDEQPCKGSIYPKLSDDSFIKFAGVHQIDLWWAEAGNQVQYKRPFAQN